MHLARASRYFNSICTQHKSCLSIILFEGTSRSFMQLLLKKGLLKNRQKCIQDNMEKRVCRLKKGYQNDKRVITIMSIYLTVFNRNQLLKVIVVHPRRSHRNSFVCSTRQQQMSAVYLNLVIAKIPTYLTSSMRSMSTMTPEVNHAIIPKFITRILTEMTRKRTSGLPLKTNLHPALIHRIKKPRA